MLAAQLPLLLALLAICCFAPGFFFLRRLRWTPLEKLCGSVGLSLVLVYLAAWGIFCFGPADQRIAYGIVAGAAALLGAASARDIWRLVRTFRIRQALAGFGFLLAWTLTMLSMIRVYSGAGWTGDWYEHFQRALFFLHRLPPGVTIFADYTLPARPPLMNVVAAFFLGLTSDLYPLFQVLFVSLNLLLLLPCFLLLPALGPRRRRGLLPLVALLAASPVVMVNATYTWTKSLAAFFVLLALAFYLAGWRKRDSVRTVAAFLALAAGLLVHFSAGPYIAVLAGHYLFRWYRARPRPWRELAVIAAGCMLLLATWFGWSAKVYGVGATLGSNTSVTASQGYKASNLEKVALNLWDTVVPSWVRGETAQWKQGNRDGETRDYAFVFYQLNLVFAMGCAGGLAVLWLLYRRLIRGKTLPERVFWRVFVPACVVVGIAVIGERDTQGQPHLTLVSMEILGLALLAANFRGLPRAAKLLLIAGCCVDFYFGVYLQARVESLENTPTRTVFPEARYSRGRFRDNLPEGDALSMAAWNTWLLKHRGVLLPKWIAELPRGHESDRLFQWQWSSVVEGLKRTAEDDARNSGGWAARHGGEIEYLGDRIAGPSGRGVEAAGWLLALVFAGLMALLARQSWTEPAAVAAAAPAKPSAARAARKRR